MFRVRRHALIARAKAGRDAQVQGVGQHQHDDLMGPGGRRVLFMRQHARGRYAGTGELVGDGERGESLLRLSQHLDAGGKGRRRIRVLAEAEFPIGALMVDLAEVERSASVIPLDCLIAPTVGAAVAAHVAALVARVAALGAFGARGALGVVLLCGKRQFTIKKKYMWWDNPDAWVKQTLYLDLLKDPQGAEDDVEIGTRYGFKFLDKVPQPDAQHHWFKVGKILDFDSQRAFDDFKWKASHSLPNDVTMGQARVFVQALEALYRAVWEDPLISYYTEHDQEYDRVLDIFVRANEGGTKLTKSDLLLSMVTAKWGEVNAREEIYGFVDELNNNLTAKNNFDKDFVMKSCLVLCDLPVQYKVENFSNSNLERIRTNWSGVKKAVRTGVDLANTFGIDRDTLTSANALISLLYYLYKDPSAKVFGTINRSEEHTSELQSHLNLVCRLLLEKKKKR